MFGLLSNSFRSKPLRDDELENGSQVSISRQCLEYWLIPSQNPVLPTDNRTAATPPRPNVHYSATHMGSPVVYQSSPSLSPTRRVTQSSQPSAGTSMALNYSPVLNAYSRGPHPQDNWRVFTPAYADARQSHVHMGPPVDHPGLPAKGGAHRLQPPTEDPMSIHCPVDGSRGHSNAPAPRSYARPDRPTNDMRASTDWETVHPSRSLSEYTMAVDHPSVVNHGGYYSRIPTPNSHPITTTPPLFSPRYSSHNPSPHAYTDTVCTPPRPMSGSTRIPTPRSAHTPLRTAAERNTASEVRYLGDIPANRLRYQHGMASETQTRGFMGDGRTGGGSEIVPPSDIFTVTSSVAPLPGIPVNTWPVSPTYSLRSFEVHW